MSVHHSRGRSTRVHPGSWPRLVQPGHWSGAHWSKSDARLWPGGARAGGNGGEVGGSDCRAGIVQALSGVKALRVWQQVRERWASRKKTRLRFRLERKGIADVIYRKFATVYIDIRTVLSMMRDVALFYHR